MSHRHVSTADSLLAFYDLLIIGAGPAGMAAAIEATRAGARVVILDENPRPGGQIYREITRNVPAHRPYLGPDYWKGKALAEAFTGTNADYVPGATVWSMESQGEGVEKGNCVVGISLGGVARMIEASAVILATGAIERPMPIPGWTLPGVLTAGAAQIALKSAGVVPQGPIVLAGCGPLLYLLATQLLDAGVSNMTLLDTSDPNRRLAALRHLPGFLVSPYLLKGLTLLLKAKRSIHIVSGIRSLAIVGKEDVEGVRFTTARGHETVSANSVLLHQGVIPAINLASAAGCALKWNEVQRTFQPASDEVGCTSARGIYVAGDGAGIGGALAAEVSGRIAAITALSNIGTVAQHAVVGKLKRLRHERRRYLRGRAFLDVLYAPQQEFLTPSDPQTIVCRCEEITAGQVRDAIALGPPGPNQLKTFIRCGMGPCQGRLCATTVTEIMAGERGTNPSEIGTYRLRSPVKPVRLAELARLPHRPSALMAVTGRDPVDHHTTNKETHHD